MSNVRAKYSQDSLTQASVGQYLTVPLPKHSNVKVMEAYTKMIDDFRTGFAGPVSIGAESNNLVADLLEFIMLGTGKDDLPDGNRLTRISGLITFGDKIDANGPYVEKIYFSFTEGLHIILSTKVVAVYDNNVLEVSHII